ncbi:MAG: putative nudix/mutt family protein [Paenibacillus sp.]|jgi:ADP-ribose pyrophosphatase YjhB (NUDIX family)|nr:putative nudix/mutt family protein [Paenibacillus sp.]
MEAFKYCPLCAKELVGDYELGKSYPHCPTGHYTYYLNQSVGAAAIIVDQGRILLERRAIQSGYGLWALPGGMAEQAESIEECVIREVLEETGLVVAVAKLLNVIGGQRVCIVFYEVSILGGSVQKSEESLELAWFSPQDIPFGQFAFPRHREVLQHWLLEGSEQFDKTSVNKHN